MKPQLKQLEISSCKTQYGLKAIKLLAIGIILLALQAIHAQAKTIGDYSRIYEGIEYATGEDPSPRQQKVWALRISLRNPDVVLYSTPSNGSDPYEVTRQATDVYLSVNDLEVAVNASFFDAGLSPHTDIFGCYIRGGNLVSDPEAAPFNSQLRFTSEKVPELTRSGLVPTGFNKVVPGAELILRNGVIQSGTGSINPHTAYGISQDKEYLIMVVVDGRQPGWSEGCSYPEMAQWMIDFGAYDAVMMDGGGSTCMVRKDTGVVNRPSDGSVRAVAVNFGVSTASASGSHGPAAAAIGGNRLDVFVRGDSGTLHAKTWTTNVTWTPWSEVQTNVVYTSPAVCNSDTSRLGFVYCGSNNNVYYTGYHVSSNTWTTPLNLGGSSSMKHEVAISSWGPDRMDIFSTGTGGNIFWKAHPAGGSWDSSWTDLGGTADFGIAASSSASGKIHVFFTGYSGDDDVYWKTYNGSWPSSWTNIGGRTHHPVGSCAWGAGQIAVFQTTTDNHLYWKIYADGGSWPSSWTDVGSPNIKMISGPAVVSRGTGLLDVFVRVSNDHLYQISYSGGVWGSWVDLGMYFD